MKKQAITALFIAALTVGMASTAVAQDSPPIEGESNDYTDNETTNVTVSVASTTALDVKPDDLQYTDNVEIGSRVSESDSGFSAIQVENTGSEDISEIWLETTMPTSDPFGTGDASSYDSANFLQVKPRSNSAPYRGDNETFHFVNRIEFLEEDSPLITTGLEDDGTWDSYSNADESFIGRMRAGNEEVYFVIAHDGSAGCDGSGTSAMRVADDPTTPDNLGSYDFSSDGSDSWTEYNISSSDATGSGYGLVEGVSLSLDSETQEYDVLTTCDNAGASESSEAHVVMTKYNVHAGGSEDIQQSDDGDAVTQIFRAQSSENLFPGESFAVDVGVQVPRGVPSDSALSEGTMTIYSQTGSS